MTIAGAAAVSLAACQDERIEARVFPDEAECVAAAASGDGGEWLTDEECRTQFAAAREEHERTAPRYADAELCEEQHDGTCYAVEQPGGGSFFVPLMMGYLLGNMMARGSAYRAQPVYRTAGGGFATPTGATVNSLRSAGAANASSFQAAPTTRGAAPMTRANVRETGGFGAARTAAPRAGGFGG
jgi:uncharacterized protein YgiB involved in biofilm formation